MKRKVKILILIFLTIFISSILIFFLNYYYSSRLKYESLPNVSELYSLFTPTAERYVTYYLRGIDCESQKYYKENSKFCFPCGKLNACFEYVFVHRTEGFKINIKNVSLTGKYDLQTEYNFHTFGIAKLLNCKCKEKCLCGDGIELVLKEKKGFVFIFPSDVVIESKIDFIAKSLGIEEKCETVKLPNITNIREDVLRQIKCGDLVVEIFNNKEVLFGI